MSAMQQANAISNVANSLLQPQIDENNILKAQVIISILLYEYSYSVIIIITLITVSE